MKSVPRVTGCGCGCHYAKNPEAVPGFPSCCECWEQCEECGASVLREMMTYHAFSQHQTRDSPKQPIL